MENQIKGVKTIKQFDLKDKPEEFGYQLTKESSRINYSALGQFKKYMEEDACIIVKDGELFSIYTRGDKRFTLPNAEIR